MLGRSTHNGRVYAMQGGFDARLSSYNRATQAQRQPGSTSSRSSMPPRSTAG